MTYNNIAQLRESYFQHSRYSGSKLEDASYDSLLQWPSKGYFDRFRPDSALLKEALASYPIRETSTVSEQIFGSQARQQKIGLKHLANILYERALLHRNHLKDIDRRLMDCHEKLSILKMHFALDGGRSQQNLEKLVIELEKQRHEEEINFWKDSTEVREKLFENVFAYGAIQRRQNMLSSVEAENA